MNGGSVPYHLRPHKAVDRRLFIDLLVRCERWRPLSNYVYVSMGAYPLEDHKLVHRLVGITQLLAFDFDDAVVARQKFNRPLETCHCLQKKSVDLISNLEGILAECQFSSAAGIVVWLDYTDPRQLGQQIREFEALLDQLRAGDIVRVTVNAHPSGLLDPTVQGARPQLAADRMARQFQNLQNRIGDYLGAEIAASDMTLEGIPLAISKSFGIAALKALPVSGENIFCPLSIIRYADGQQMLSITGAVVARKEKDALLERLDLRSWPFGSLSWSNLHRLVVPALTVRERLFLERGVMTRTPKELISELGFEMAGDVELGEFLESYKDYYRFYPTLLPAEL